MANPVPLTLINSTDSTTMSYVYIGTKLTPYLDNYKVTLGTFWYVVFDRTNLNVVTNFQSDDNGNVPAALTQYINNPQYMLIVLGNSISTDNSGPPQGNLYTFFQEMGSGSALAELEQLIAATGSGMFQAYSYTLVAVMDGSVSFDYVIYNAPPQTKGYALQLMPVDNGNGGVIYTPVKLNDE